MKILITGKNGQVGQCLQLALQAFPNVDVLAYGREELDITNSLAVQEVVSRYKPNVIINAAAYTAVDKAESEQSLAFDINATGPKNLAMAANDIGSSIIHISTDYVFAGNHVDEYKEAEATFPKSVYGQSKLAGEVAVAEACERHVIIRTSWVFSEFGNNFVKTMLRLAKSNSSLNIVGDQFGGPTYAGDIASAILQIAFSLYNGNQAYGIYHFSGYPTVNWADFAQAIFQQAYTKGLIESAIVVNSISTEQYPTPASRPKNSRLNCDKIYSKFNVSASNWQAALKNINKYQNEIEQ